MQGPPVHPLRSPRRRGRQGRATLSRHSEQRLLSSSHVSSPRGYQQHAVDEDGARQRALALRDEERGARRVIGDLDQRGDNVVAPVVPGWRRQE